MLIDHFAHTACVRVVWYTFEQDGFRAVRK
ncbi:hypothetical protein D039_4831A, partial [Vibrio parahaemolyticus EKP-028]